MRNLYIVKRGQKPEWHKAPWTAVLVTSLRKVALEEAGASDERSTVWWCELSLSTGALLLRYLGHDVDYGGVVRCFTLWDGHRTGFQHDRQQEPWTLLDGAVMWDWHKRTASLIKAGIVCPPEQWSQSRIAERAYRNGYKPPLRGKAVHWFEDMRRD